MAMGERSGGKEACCEGSGPLPRSHAPTLSRSHALTHFERCMMNFLRPGKVEAPEEPPSTAVVTPRDRHASSGSTEIGVHALLLDGSGTDGPRVAAGAVQPAGYHPEREEKKTMKK